jgi:NitT/TauT family transport system substrate-binding protein
MNIHSPSTWTRRETLRRLSVASCAGLFGLGTRTAAAEPPPETPTIIVNDVPVLCVAPQHVAEAFLRMEGFTDVRYPGYKGAISENQALKEGKLDFTSGLVTDFIAGIDAGAPITVLAGLHAGCIETFANDRVPSLRDLAGKKVAISAPGDHMHIFLSSVAAYIGLDPSRDIEWVVERNFRNWPLLLEDGQVDVVAAFPPQTFVIRESGSSHVILNNTTDNPWRHYFCCMVTARREFVSRYPVATKRALRAFVKAIQFCSLEPQRAARILLERGITTREDFALRTLREVPYGAWRTYDPEDTLRFYALRLREAGIVKHTPRDLIARGADFRFEKALRRELKA